MASNNDLLGLGLKKGAEEEEVFEVFSPLWLYEKVTGKGKLVKTVAVYDSLDLNTWVDHPAKCDKVPVPEVPKTETECVIAGMAEVYKSLGEFSAELTNLKLELEVFRVKLDSFEPERPVFNEEVKVEIDEVKVEPLFTDKKKSAK